MSSTEPAPSSSESSYRNGPGHSASGQSPMQLPPLSLPPQRHHSDPLAPMHHSPYPSSSPAFNQNMMSASPIGMSTTPSPSQFLPHSPSGGSRTPYLQQAQQPHHPQSPFHGSDVMLTSSSNSASMNNKMGGGRRPSSNPMPSPLGTGSGLQRSLHEQPSQLPPPPYGSCTSSPATMLSPLKDNPHVETRQIKSVPGSPSMYGYAPSPAMNRLNSYEDSYSNHSSPLSNGPPPAQPGQHIPNGAGPHIQQQQGMMPSAPNGHHQHQSQAQLQRQHMLNQPQFSPGQPQPPPPYHQATQQQVINQKMNAAAGASQGGMQNSPRNSDLMMLPPSHLPPSKQQQSLSHSNSPAMMLPPPSPVPASSPIPPPQQAPQQAHQSPTTTMPLLQTALQRTSSRGMSREEAMQGQQTQELLQQTPIAQMSPTERSLYPTSQATAQQQMALASNNAGLQNLVQRQHSQGRGSEQVQQQSPAGMPQQQGQQQPPSLISKILSSEKPTVQQPNQMQESQQLPQQQGYGLGAHPHQQMLSEGMAPQHQAQPHAPPVSYPGQQQQQQQPSRVIEMLSKPPLPHGVQQSGHGPLPPHPVGPPPMQHPMQGAPPPQNDLPPHPSMMQSQGPPPQAPYRGSHPTEMRGMPPPPPPPHVGQAPLPDLPETASSLLMPVPGIQSIESEDMDFNMMMENPCQPGSSSQFLVSSAVADAERSLLIKRGFTPESLAHLLSSMKKRQMSVKDEYREYKRKFKYLVYENECYQDEVRNLQRKLLKLSRDKNFLLDRLQTFEKFSDSSDDDSDSGAVGILTGTAPAVGATLKPLEEEKPKIKRRVRTIAPATAQSQPTRKRILPTSQTSVLDGSSSGKRSNDSPSPSLSPSPATTPLPTPSAAYPPTFTNATTTVSPMSASSPSLRQYAQQSMGIQQQARTMRSPLRGGVQSSSGAALRGQPPPYGHQQQSQQMSADPNSSFPHPGQLRSGHGQRHSAEAANSQQSYANEQNMSPSASINQTIQRVVNLAMSSASSCAPSATTTAMCSQMGGHPHVGQHPIGHQQPGSYPYHQYPPQQPLPPMSHPNYPPPIAGPPTTHHPHHRQASGSMMSPQPPHAHAAVHSHSPHHQQQPPMPGPSHPQQHMVYGQSPQMLHSSPLPSSSSSSSSINAAAGGGPFTQSSPVPQSAGTVTTTVPPPPTRPPRSRQRKRTATARQDEAGYPPLGMDPEAIIKKIKNAHALKEASKVLAGQSKPPPHTSGGRKQTNSFSSSGNPPTPQHVNIGNTPITAASGHSIGQQPLPASIVNSRKRSSEEEMRNGGGTVQRIGQILQAHAEEDMKASLDSASNLDKSSPHSDTLLRNAAGPLEMEEPSQSSEEKATPSPNSSQSGRPNGLMLSAVSDLQPEDEDSASDQPSAAAAAAAASDVRKASAEMQLKEEESGKEEVIMETDAVDGDTDGDSQL